MLYLRNSLEGMTCKVSLMFTTVPNVLLIIHLISHLSRSFHLFSTVGVITFTTIKPPTAGNVLASIPETFVTFGANTIDSIPWIPVSDRYTNSEQFHDAYKRDCKEKRSIRSSATKMRNKVLKAMVGCGMKDEQRFIEDTEQIEAKLTEIKNGTHIIRMGSLEWALLKSKLVAINLEYRALPSHLQTMFQGCYTHEDLEAFKMACEAQCDEWKIVEGASIALVSSSDDLRTFEDAPDPTFTPSFHAPQRRSLKKSFDFKKCHEDRIQATIQRGKNKRTELVKKRRQARSDFDDDSTIVSDSTEELNQWFPILPAIVQDDVAVEEEDEVDESEFPSIGTIIEVPSTEEDRSDSTLPAIVQEDAGVEAAAPQDDVVFDTAGDEPFDIEVDEVEQVTTVSDAEHASIVLFLAAFTTADVPVEEDEAPAPDASETPSTAPVIHEDVSVEALAEAAPVEEPLVLESIIEQSNNAASRAMKELESTLDGHYWAISEGRSRRRRTQTNFFSPC